ARHNGACFSRKSVEFLLLIARFLGFFDSGDGPWKHNRWTLIPRVRSLMFVRDIPDFLHQSGHK
ncbi:hypothetical protein, partial [Tetragenococcus halophilus]|uniref:hypothetical protein n=1 Tax=Tetragenococcus halophilus TaxID=51669 RepID=UPI001CA5063D